MRRLMDYFLKSSGERYYLNPELDVIKPNKILNTKMSYKTMRRKSQKYISKIQKLTPARPEKRMLNFLSLLKIIVMNLNKAWS